MITDNFQNKNFYTNKFPFLKEVFDFLSSLDKSSEERKYVINENIYAMLETSRPKKKEDQKPEVHRKYVDLQFIIDGKDVIGWKSMYDCKDVYKKYNSIKDIAFFNETPDFQIKLSKGQFAIFFPQDAHAPLCGQNPVKKCIVKISSELFK